MGEKVAFDSARSRDADNDALSYAWDFGDGSTAFTPQASHAYAAPGAFTARLRASDPSGASDEATTAILVDGAWRSTGSFGVGDSTAQSRSVPVVDGAKHLAATLSFPAGVGNDLTLVVKDATGREVARVGAPGMANAAKPDDTITRAFDLGADRLAPTGAWTIVVED